MTKKQLLIKGNKLLVGCGQVGFSRELSINLLMAYSVVRSKLMVCARCCLQRVKIVVYIVLILRFYSCADSYKVL